ncbi:DUF2207 domain-containing protein [Rhizobium sp. SSA_523]|uniref:DUF2207 domain-containing protein n=1 Tax=Rhizobium sp. SSA_523 TaxID=2952477 RepID=UPI0020919359|nr:DUF2207 domain-containing protein [Rhizobium sp. SSA_523]MCO5731102.1 DUF2207 domain-containing protein [Rhizobium sp. SSA_523]WKC24098.1 DUF2207 domain-containing protein [Rhizobium sp. SSA_523]
MTAGFQRAALLVLAVLLPVLSASGAARAAEFVDSYRSEIAIAADGAVTVTEIITVNAEGRDIRRGIFRDFPLYMVDARGRRQKVGFDVLSAARDGRPEEFHTETISGGIRIYLGSADTLLPVGRHTYELTYRTDRQIRYFDDHDEFYWNVTGNGWIFDIRRVTALISLPPGVSATRTAVYTGPEGSRQSAARIGGSAAVPAFSTTAPLAAGEGMTVVVALPKGSIAPPGAAEQQAWFLRDNINLILGGGGLLLVTLYYVWFWRRVGRDPEGGVVVPRWDAPDGLSPALVNYVYNKGFSGAGWDALSASFIDLAVKGHVTLDDLKNRIVVRRTQKPKAGPLPTGQAYLLSELAVPGDELIIDKDNGERVQKVGRGFRSAIEKEHRGRYYKSNIGYTIGGIGLSLFVGLVLILFGDFDPESIGFLVPPMIFGFVWGGIALKAGRALLRKRGLLARIGAILVFAILGFMALSAAVMLFVGIVDSLETHQWPVMAAFGGLTLVNAVFFFLMGAPTPLGAKLMAGVEGLKTYLTLAERDRLNMAGAPQMSPQHFETLLPYAVALGVEKPWSETFETWLASAAAGAAAAAYQPVWYHGGSIGDLGTSIGGFSSSMASTIASTIPQPKSSSSSGFSSSGGFSGGGGGGGGGGGW